MSHAAFTVFGTAIGWCGLAWRADGAILRILLPENSADALRAKWLRLFPHGHEAAPPTAVDATASAIEALLAGEPHSFAGAPLALDAVPAFEAGVYAVARTIPPGRTLTYGAIADRIGKPDAARAVGRALGRNPFPIIVPCHRVVAAAGKLGGFSAPGGQATKRRLLAIERSAFGEEPTLFDTVAAAIP